MSARIRGDFADVVAVRPGQHEILNALSAAHLRKLPPTRVHVTVTAQVGGGERTIAEYTLDHVGAFDRVAPEP